VLDDGVDSDFGKGLRVNSTGDVDAGASLEVFEVFFREDLRAAPFLEIDLSTLLSIAIGSD
jgi:hypothetical protein